MWNRNYRLIIKSSQDLESIIFKPPMQIVFNVYGAASNPFQIADITVYGVSQETRDRLYKLYDTVILEAGYEKDISPIFIGQINNVETGKDGVSTYIKLYCYSRLRELQKARVDKSWGRETPAIEIITDVAQTLSTNVELIGNFSNLPSAMYGKTFSHNSIEAMEQLSIDYDFYWVSQEAKITIVKNGAARSEIVHDINIYTGMEGCPRTYMAGLEVDLRLNNKIKAFDSVNLQAKFEQFSHSEMYTEQTSLYSRLNRNIGKYIVLSISHRGDYYHNNWTTTLGCALWTK